MLLGRGAAAYKLHGKKKSEKKWQNKNKYKSKIPIKEETREDKRYRNILVELRYLPLVNLELCYAVGELLPINYAV